MKPAVWRSRRRGISPKQVGFEGSFVKRFDGIYMYSQGWAFIIADDRR
jgi:hypothetical protein